MLVGKRAHNIIFRAYKYYTIHNATYNIGIKNIPIDIYLILRHLIYFTCYLLTFDGNVQTAGRFDCGEFVTLRLPDI